jgi:hypothetical protein
LISGGGYPKPPWILAFARMTMKRTVVEQEEIAENHTPMDPGPPKVGSEGLHQDDNDGGRFCQTCFSAIAVPILSCWT